MNKMRFTSFLTAAALLSGMLFAPVLPAAAVGDTETVTSQAQVQPTLSDGAVTPAADTPGELEEPVSTEATLDNPSLPETTTEPASTEPAYTGETMTNPALPLSTETTLVTNAAPATDATVTNPVMPSATETTTVTTVYAETMTNPAMPGETTATETTTTTQDTAVTMTNPVMPTTTEPTSTDPAEPRTYIPGDVNGDGSVNAKDATVILIAAARIGTGADSNLNDSALAAANVVIDNAINALDATLILRYAAACGTLENPPTLDEFRASVA